MRAHIAARMEGDWLGLITQCPERVAEPAVSAGLRVAGGASAALFARCVRKASA
jgi:hypothetical protein